jgi:nucleosome binding factor SPN SPT16 subunit
VRHVGGALRFRISVAGARTSDAHVRVVLASREQNSGQDPPWHGVRAFVAGTGKHDDETTKSAALQSWLLSYELTGAILLTPHPLRKALL